jgi:hypothetical protein
MTGTTQGIMGQQDHNNHRNDAVQQGQHKAMKMQMSNKLYTGSGSREGGRWQ